MSTCWDRLRYPPPSTAASGPSSAKKSYTFMLSPVEVVEACGGCGEFLHLSAARVRVHAPRWIETTLQVSTPSTHPMLTRHFSAYLTRNRVWRVRGGLGSNPPRTLHIWAKG